MIQYLPDQNLYLSFGCKLKLIFNLCTDSCIVFFAFRTSPIHCPLYPDCLIWSDPFLVFPLLFMSSAPAGSSMPCSSSLHIALCHCHCSSLSFGPLYGPINGRVGSVLVISPQWQFKNYLLLPLLSEDVYSTAVMSFGRYVCVSAIKPRKMFWILKRYPKN